LSELRSAIDEYRSEAHGELNDSRADEDFAELQRAIQALEAERLRRLADLDRRGCYRRDGYLSTVSWLVAAFAMSGGAARELVKTARCLEAMPATRAAFESGAVSSGAVRALIAARDAEPEAFDRAEAVLLNAARQHSVRDLGRVTAYWRQAVQREGAVDGEERLFARRYLHASAMAFGVVRIDGELDPEAGEALLTAIRAITDAEARLGSTDDDRTPRQRRADALGEVCRHFLDHGDRPTVGGERPHLTVTVGLETLQGGRAGVCEAEHVGPVSPGMARRLACEAAVIPAVLGSGSELLDLGRRSAVVSPALRRAVALRDKRCRFPGCDRPHAWCDAHHVIHWADGGATSLANLILLCRRHHRLIHQGFGLEMHGEHPVFRRPDGSVLDERAPP